MTISKIKVGSTNHDLSAATLTTTAAGSSTVPVYWTSGKPAAVSSVAESYLSWGGKNLTGTISPIDAAASSIHSANRFQFAKAAGITVEYSTDGSTFADYGATDANKIALVSGIGTSFMIGKTSGAGKNTANHKVRITLHATNMGVYTRLQKLLINITTNYASGSNVEVEKAMKGSESTFSTIGTYSISGWSGWNSIPIGAAFGGGSTQTSNIAVLRLTFGITAVNSSQNSALTVLDIIGIGDTYWAFPSDMAKTGHLYSWDTNKNATFPAGVTATTFTGALSGNATSATTAASCSGNAATATTATKLGTNAGSATQPVYFTNGVPTACTYTLGKSVPSNAVFTDTVYTLPNATSSTLGGVKVGSNITVSSGTISLTKANVTAALGYTPPTSDTNTDTKVTSSANNSSKIYFTGTSNSAGETSTQLLNTGIYADGETGYLHITNLLHIGGDTAWSKIMHNGTDTIITNSSGTGVLKLSAAGVLSLSTNSGSSFTNVSLSGHTHNYAGSSSAGGAATSANKVNTNLAIKLNGGTTEGTNLFTFNGSAAKTVNITPSAIGAAASSHTHQSLTGSNGGVVSLFYDLSNTNINYLRPTSTAQTYYLGTAAVPWNYIYAGTGGIHLPNATAMMAKNASGTNKPLIYLSTANHLTLGNPAEGNPLDGGIRLYAPNESIYLISNDGVRMDCSGGSTRWYSYANSTAGTTAIFNTDEDNIAMLGSSSYRWYRLYQSASSVSTSDEREKSDIMSIADYPVTYSRDGSGNMFEQLFSKLQPKTYTLNVENSGDLHIGFIAQDIVASMEELGLSEDDLGLVIHDYWTDEETGEEKDRYGLAYEEFMALNTYMIQKQQTTIEEQQVQILTLEERIAQLEALVNSN